MYIAYKIILEKLHFALNDHQHDVESTDNKSLLKTIKCLNIMGYHNWHISRNWNCCWIAVIFSTIW
jgi:hypothetical protein